MSETSIWSGEILSLGEGPLTHHLRGSLIWVDINESFIQSFNRMSPYS